MIGNTLPPTSSAVNIQIISPQNFVGQGAQSGQNPAPQVRVFPSNGSNAAGMPGHVMNTTQPGASRYPGTQNLGTQTPWGMNNTASPNPYNAGGQYPGTQNLGAQNLGAKTPWGMNSTASPNPYNVGGQYPGTQNLGTQNLGAQHPVGSNYGYAANNPGNNFPGQSFARNAGGDPRQQLEQAYLGALNARNEAEAARNQYLGLANALNQEAAQQHNMMGFHSGMPSGFPINPVGAYPGTMQGPMTGSPMVDPYTGAPYPMNTSPAGMDPYAANMNPYALGYNNPGGGPSVNPYDANPYGPYGPDPYAAGMNPYGVDPMAGVPTGPNTPFPDPGSQVMDPYGAPAPYGPGEFSPGPSPQDPNDMIVGDPELMPLTVDQLNAVIDNPPVLQKRANAIQEAVLRGNVNQQTFNILTDLINTDVSQETDPTNQDNLVYTNIEMPFWALGILNQKQNAGQPIANLPGVAQALSVLKDPNSPSKAKGAAAAFVHYIAPPPGQQNNRMFKKLMKAMNSEVKRSGNPEIQDFISAITSGKKIPIPTATSIAPTFRSTLDLVA